jgi:uncharacterized OB-fold protein
VQYAVALVELDEGVRLMGNVLTDDVAAISVGDRVEAVFERIDDELTLPQLRPASG